MLILLSDGAPARIRTADLLITNQLLYQLSYKGIRINEVFNVKSQINQHLKDANVFLEVKRTNFPAVNLYLSFGFQEINIRKDYYSDGEDAIEMVKKVNNYGMV